MISMQTRGEQCGPVIVCDACKQVFSDIDKAIAVYVRPDQESALTSCYHVHKGQCDRALKDQLGLTFYKLAATKRLSRLPLFKLRINC